MRRVRCVGSPFHELNVREQEEILKSIHEAKPQAAQELWKQMNIERFWALLVSDVVAVYYAHPWAWDEIGFGGPAYPRGYMRLEEGEPEPWEVEEQRYEWKAPADSINWPRCCRPSSASFWGRRWRASCHSRAS